MMSLPWAWAAGSCFALFALAAYLSRRPRWRALWLNLAVISGMFGIYEVVLDTRQRTASTERYEGDYNRTYFASHDLLGYGPSPNQNATVARYVNDELVYEVTYGINEDGLRVTPSSPSSTAVAAILFFGCSVTFGEGVDDEMTMPYRVGELIPEHEYQTYNFGFHGYGPHQMLAALEFGLVESIVNSTVRVVVYQAIPAHVQRAAGRVTWDRHGPRYRLGPSGEAQFAGHFDDDIGPVSRALASALETSATYQRLFGVHRPTNEEDIALYVAIVRRARDLVEELFPGAEFHVLLWGAHGEATFDAMIAGLSGANIPTHPIAEILPGYKQHPEQYEIGPYEPHPNALAHGLIAEYVVSRILSSEH